MKTKILSEKKARELLDKGFKFKIASRATVFGYTPFLCVRVNNIPYVVEHNGKLVRKG